MPNITNFFNLLQEKGITAKAFSNETGISTGNISDWKHDRCLPSADKLILIADYFGCSIDYLLGRTDSPEINCSPVITSTNSPYSAVGIGNTVTTSENTENIESELLSSFRKLNRIDKLETLLYIERKISNE